MAILFYAILVLLATMLGAICGNGGGVIIRPALDALSPFSASEISFISGTVVLAMSLYSVLAALIKREQAIKWQIASFLGFGAAIGGLLGNSLFTLLKNNYSEASLGLCQSLLLAVCTGLAGLYLLFQKRIKEKTYKSRLIASLIGLSLGLISAFIGIGGGPINLVVLLYFYSMTNKEAVQNSLYIIVWAQLFRFGMTLSRGDLPNIDLKLLLLLIVCALIGPYLGRMINRHLSEKQVHKLLLLLATAITGLAFYNCYHYALLL